MKARKQILGILLSAFVFMAVHDFIIGYIDADTQTELYMHKVEQVALCDASVLHELIHMSLMTVTQSDTSFDENILLRTWVHFYHDSTFSSSLEHRLYRPPIA